ncbi:thiamine pyrophosphate-binding protein [Paralimibaculum aggregatum]|uniref:Thiamine pyrophosphate-binding protein n=1 Tax=Paralimibaculum aggregatum TaxID=3036245 RepID=A0ABQ6LNJ7_9RHOB|nr:thiamine pyrophosphate-binding protein [Limibaculum sp. NKW23]GMG84011.1 thiamine pyrophosphate-binding protein [Limibaculum sp. NKW23]
MRGADLLIKTLAEAGVTRIFSLSGNQIMPVYDACIDAGIEIVHTRHEAAALYMAEAHAQLTGEVAVAMVTAGAGMANAMGPLFTALESDTPVLLLTGDSPVAQDGMGAFQEMPQTAMAGPLAKLSIRPLRAADMGRDTARALRLAQSGRPGPVHMALAFDVVEGDAGEGAVPQKSAFAREPMPAGAGDLAALRAALAGAARPVVLAGPVLTATRFDALAALAGALDAPVVPMESPRGLKDPALGAIGQLFASADLVVSLGKKVDFTLGFGSTRLFDAAARWHVVQASAEERDRAHRNLGDRLAQCVAADPRDVARQLLDTGAGSARAAWRDEAAKLLAARSTAEVPEGRISPAALCAAVQRQIDAAPEAVLICDGGEFGQWSQACVQAPARVINGVSGAIGGGLCYGIAARYARPGATVFSLMGDGTAGFHFAEFETAARQGIPMVVVIGNDLRWNAEHQIQLRNYGPQRTIGCELSAARYDLAAAAMGGHGEFVTDPGELDAALARAVQSGKPACVNVMIEGLPAPAGPAH